MSRNIELGKIDGGVTFVVEGGRIYLLQLKDGEFKVLDQKVFSTNNLCKVAVSNNITGDPALIAGYYENGDCHLFK